MRQAFFIGAIVLWVAINILGGIAQMETPLQDEDSYTGLTQEDTLKGLAKPEVTEVNVVTIFTKVWDFLKLAGSILTLYHPALWQGSAMTIYFLLIMPIGISFWAVFLLSLRGVGSG